MSDPKKRELYDLYGEDGLKEGFFPGGRGGFGSSGGGFHPSDPADIFAQFFGGGGFGNGAFGGGFGSGGPSFGGGSFRRSQSGFGEMPSRPVKDPAIRMKLPCTLEELYTGSTRKMKISARRMDGIGQSRSESEILSIDIKPGWKQGTKITFAEKGDQAPGRVPADIVFEIEEKPHSRFRREKDDLYYTYKISLKDALCGCIVEVKTLADKVVRLKVEDVITPSTKKIISGHGMPISKSPGSFGNLHIQFDVAFPTRLTEEQKNVLRSTLP